MRSEKVLFKFGQKNKNIKLLRRNLNNDDKSMLIEINEQNYIQNFIIFVMQIKCSKLEKYYLNTIYDSKIFSDAVSQL